MKSTFEVLQLVRENAEVIALVVSIIFARIYFDVEIWRFDRKYKK